MNRNLKKSLFLYYTLVFSPTTLLADPYQAFQALEMKVREFGMKDAEGRSELRGLISDLRKGLPANELTPASGDQTWLFPLPGYSLQESTAKDGKSYIGAGYCYFDGNKSKGHPALDLFINDRNYDEIDDRTKKPEPVLAVLDGVVIAYIDSWKPGSAYRGGNYVRLYHPRLNLMSYYAHLGALHVKLGQWVKKGDTLGLVGRTGANAIKHRSPTHLHFSVMRVAADGALVPFNPYSMWR